MLKATAQTIFKRLGCYERLRASWVYDAYWLIADRRIIATRHEELDFYRRLLRGFRPGDLIFDIGANVGYKTDLFLRMGARVVAVEPEPGGQKVLRERFLQYRITRPPLTIVGKAVSDHEGHVPMWTERPCFEMNTLSRKWVEKLRRDEQASFATELAVEAIRLDTLIAHYGRPFFIKIDVEGYELKVLRGLRSPVPYIAFEVNLPDFRDEGRECIGLLADLDPDGEFNHNVMSPGGVGLKKWLRRSDFLDIYNACRRPMDVLWRAAHT